MDAVLMRQGGQGTACQFGWCLEEGKVLLLLPGDLNNNGTGNCALQSLFEHT